MLTIKNYTGKLVITEGDASFTILKDNIANVKHVPGRDYIVLHLHTNNFQKIKHSEVTSPETADAAALKLKIDTYLS